MLRRAWLRHHDFVDAPGSDHLDSLYPAGPSHGRFIVSGFNFRLYLENGEDIGTFATAVPDWSVGDEFFDSAHNEFRILNIVTDEALGDGDFSGAFVVTPTALSE